MPTFFRSNVAVLLAFLLPVAVIAAVAASAYLPSLFLSTNYDFVYAQCIHGMDYYPYNCNRYLGDRFSVVDGRLVVHDVDPAKYDRPGEPIERTSYDARVFYHDTEKNESREISIDEAQALTLNNLLTSPDGVTVSADYDRGAEFFPFFDGGSSHGYSLKKGNSRVRLHLVGDDGRYYYQDNFRFIGWVLPGRNSPPLP